MTIAQCSTGYTQERAQTIPGDKSLIFSMELVLLTSDDCEFTYL